MEFCDGFLEFFFVIANTNIDSDKLDHTASGQVRREGELFCKTKSGLKSLQFALYCSCGTWINVLPKCRIGHEAALNVPILL